LKVKILTPLGQRKEGDISKKSIGADVVYFRDEAGLTGWAEAMHQSAWQLVDGTQENPACAWWAASGG